MAAHQEHLECYRVFWGYRCLPQRYLVRFGHQRSVHRGGTTSHNAAHMWSHLSCSVLALCPLSMISRHGTVAHRVYLMVVTHQMGRWSTLTLAHLHVERAVFRLRRS